ncbi:phosphatidylinositol-specific phospholipase C/glycerophosphodiester phosphodiesterase family protein [Niabella aurantiaca]|uniref:phosphatidylinositol-specific phospholipase C/glycerophosphodiester phosphodiesterase family protein n=1 Tax=Niabella aurantiaca TaxID=379900 RepID=UPI0003817F81|nr:phosphatidylinositol-specific phospholipase C/glycerophosphodiester phosphodiesterase family protein [Niabella aurantiaca]
MRINLFFICFFTALAAGAQPGTYTVQNAHSHNDYEQERPFWEAYNHGFGSIEADVFLVNGRLPVAHNAKDIRFGNDLKKLYLNPLQECIRKNGGSVYKDSAKKLLLLIDCKTEGGSTLKAIIAQVEQYPAIIQNKSIRIVITGNQPNKDSLFAYPAFIGFDGDLTHTYTPENLARVALFSANFKNYSKWNGAGAPDSASKAALINAIRIADRAQKPIRFWGAPDNAEAWSVLQKLGVGYLNTDKIEELSAYLK